MEIPQKYVELAELVREQAKTKISLEELLLFVEKLETVEPGENAMKVAAGRYFRRNEKGEICEDWADMLQRVARDIATDGDGKVEENLVQIFQKVMAAGLFFPNSPTLMNAGTAVQQLQACFVLPIEDSMESIFETLKHSALIQKSGGGIGYFLGKIRQQGAIVRSTGGQASGPLSFLSVYNKVSAEIRQGGRRRGASLATLNYNHPDIMEFIDSKRESEALNNFNLSVRVDNSFMQAVEKDAGYDLIDPCSGEPTGKKLAARQVFNRLVENAYRSGEPGLLFEEAINAENPTPHLGRMEATNPCIAGDMLVATGRGLETMEDLCRRGYATVLTDQRVQMFGVSLAVAGGGERVFMGKEKPCSRGDVHLYPVTGFWSPGKKPVYLLQTMEGYFLKATAEHLILTAEGWKSLKELQAGEKIFIQPGCGSFNRDGSLPVKVEKEFKGKNGRTCCFNLPQKWSKELGEVLGWLTGRGRLRLAEKKARVDFCFDGEDTTVFSYLKPMLDRYYGKKVRVINRKNGCIHLSYRSHYFARFFASLGVTTGLAITKKVPAALFTGTEEAVCGFLRGLFSTNGAVRFSPEESAGACLTSRSKKLLQEVQLLLLNLNIQSSIHGGNKAPGLTCQYTKKNGEKRKYPFKGVLFELQVTGESLPLFLKKIGFLGGRQALVWQKFNRQDCHADYFVAEVQKIVPLGMAEVYDLQEPVTSSFIANGIVVHNCGEQPLLPYESCNLGSINLARLLKIDGKGRFVPDWEKIRLVTWIATIFLDRVIDRNKAPLPQVEKISLGNRKIGLGIMGLAQYLIRQGIPYNTREGFAAAERVMQEIAVQSKVASRHLALEKGNFPNYAGSVWEHLQLPQRNATTTTIAPTGSLSIFADASPGAEPLFGVGFARNILDGRIVQVDHVFEESWQTRFGEELPAVLKEQIGEKGPEGISQLMAIPEDLRRLFLCAHDIVPSDHIQMQASLQKWVDNAVSKTINAPEDATLEDCREAFLQAWRLGVKGITYYRDGSREKQVITSTAVPKKGQEFKGAVPRGRPETTYGQTTRKRIGFCGKLYVTVNKEIMEDGTEQVCEVFTSVGEEGCPPLSNALAKIISISIRAGVDLDEIVENLREEKCPSCIMHPETTVLSCTDFIGQELAKAAQKKISYRLNAAGGPKNIRICSVCKIGYMIPDALCSYCDHCGYTTCGS